MSTESAHLSTFGAETEAEIRSTSNEGTYTAVVIANVQCGEGTLSG